MTGFDGAVLCGGRSRRMGTDKALVEVDGRAMAVRVADALDAAGARVVTAVGGQADLLRRLELDVRADRWPGEGPLGGVITALAEAGTAPTVVVAACDLLAPDPALLATLARLRDEGAVDVVVPQVADRLQWVCAAWNREVVGALSECFATGERSLAAAASSLRIMRVPLTDPSATADADVPADLPGGGAGVRIAYAPGVDIPEIDIETLSSRLAAGAPVFDVRQPHEFEEVRVPGVRLVPLAEVPERVDEFPTDDTVYVICRSGARSARAVEFLRAQGIDAVNVAGGTLRWIESDKPVDTGG